MCLCVCVCMCVRDYVGRVNPAPRPPTLALPPDSTWWTPFSSQISAQKSTHTHTQNKQTNKQTKKQRQEQTKKEKKKKMEFLLWLSGIMVQLVSVVLPVWSLSDKGVLAWVTDEAQLQSLRQELPYATSASRQRENYNNKEKVPPHTHTPPSHLSLNHTHPHPTSWFLIVFFFTTWMTLWDSCY